MELRVDTFGLLAQWVGAQTGDEFSQSDLDGAVSVGLLHEGRVVAAATFFNLRGEDATFTFALADKRAATRSTGRQLMEFAFGTLGRQRLTTFIRSDNAKSIKAARQYGFVQEGTIRRGFAGKDVFIFGLLRDECRFLPPS